MFDFVVSRRRLPYRPSGDMRKLVVFKYFWKGRKPAVSLFIRFVRLGEGLKYALACIMESASV